MSGGTYNEELNTNRDGASKEVNKGQRQGRSGGILPYVRVPLAGMVMEVPWEKTAFVIRWGRMGEVHSAAGERGFRVAGAASQRW